MFRTLNRRTLALLPPRSRLLNTSTSTSTSAHPPLTVWWDSSCPLCTREINMLKRLDTNKTISFIALSATSPTPTILPPSSSPSSSPSTSPQNSCPPTKKELLARFHAQEKGKEIVSGARAFAAMWKRMPQKQLRWIGERAEGNRAFMGVLEGAYRGFLVVRPAVQWGFRRLGL